jgi:hypothetical protein
MITETALDRITEAGAILTKGIEEMTEALQLLADMADGNSDSLTAEDRRQLTWAPTMAKELIASMGQITRAANLCAAMGRVV